MSNRKTTLTRYRGWLPANPAIHKSFISKLVQLSDKLSRNRTEHTSAVVDFQTAIQSDPEMFNLFNQMFLQVSNENQISDFDTLLYMLDNIVAEPPKFHTAKDENGEIIREPIGVPIYLLFDLLSNTAAAYDLFRNPAFNLSLKELLDSWGKYLTTDDSNKTLTDEGEEGWFTEMALESLESDGRGIFNETYVTPDPNAVNRGYSSWDQFFTRQLQSEARPVDAPDNKTLIHSACESTVYRIARNVQYHDQFWLKDQKYSLYDMLDRDQESAKEFVGGTVYQALLSPLDYHRWHSPVDGEIVKTYVVPGTYYAVLPDDGAPEDDPDLKPGDPRGAIVRSQSWLTLSSTRALIYIKADNTDIGLVGFIAVGMGEVSTCEITVQEGDKVSTGDALGMFHFGGSSHTLIFGPQANVVFADNVKVDQHLFVNSVIAQVQVHGA